jgi:hypothetical protein
VRKSKKAWLTLIGVVALAGVFVFASCGPSAQEIVAPEISSLKSQAAAIVSTLEGINEWAEDINGEVSRLATEVAEANMMAQKPEPKLLIVPNMGGGRYKAAYYGIGFEPNQTLTICMPVSREGQEPVKSCVGPGGIGAPFQTDDLGTFSFTGVRGPREPGVYPITVYDEADNALASAIMVIE